MVAYLCLETTLAKGEPSTYFISAILLWVLFDVRPCTPALKLQIVSNVTLRNK